MNTLRFISRARQVASTLLSLAALQAQTASSATFPVEIIRQEGRLTNAVFADYDAFGRTVSLSGDTAAVGAYRKVDVFQRQSGLWTWQGSLTRPRGDFASAVALSGNRLVVSDPYPYPDGVAAGAVYIYEKSSEPAWNAWNITDNDSAAPSASYSVDVPSPLDSTARTNGWRYRLVARLLDDYESPFSMVFLYGDGVTRYGAYLDLNDSGNLVAGLLGASPQERVLTTNQSRATVYHVHELVFNPTNQMVTYYFDGRAIHTWAGQSQVNNGIFWGSGSTGGGGVMNVQQVRFEILQTGLVLGSYEAGTADNPPVAPNPVSQGWMQATTNGPNSSVGPVSPDFSTVWKEETTLIPSDGAHGDAFGRRLAVSGDTLVVGAPFDDDGGTDTGSAYVFARNGSNWIQQKKLAPSVRAPSDFFGWHVAIDGSTIVVGAPSGFTLPGRAFVFARNGTNWSEQGLLAASDGASQDRFGAAVATHGNRIAVSAEWDDHAPSAFAGSVYVFELSGSNTWSQSAKFFATNTPPSQGFGNSLAMHGDTILVGGLYYGDHWVYARTGTAWSQVHYQSYPDTVDPSVFDVAIDGQTFIVGVTGIESESGAAYVYGPDFSNAAGVAQFVRKQLYYADARSSGTFDPATTAFRYKHLLYGQDDGGIRPRFELMTNFYGSAERDLSILAENELLKGLALDPNNVSLGGLLLDIYYDRAVAESIFAKLALEEASLARFGRGISPPSATGFFIDNELPQYRQVLDTSRFALQGHFDLLQRPLTVQTPGATNSRWAARVIDFSSQWTEDGPSNWYAVQALGQPNTYPAHGDIPTAWASATADGQPEFLELEYDNPAPISSVAIYETYHPGAVNRISVRTPTASWVPVWSGVAAPAGTTSRIFTVTFPLTALPVDAIRIDIDSPAVPNWNEIDAVSISTVTPAGTHVDATFAHRLFRNLVPARGLAPATYTNAGGISVVTTNAIILTNGMLFSGYKDLVLLFDLLRDYGRTAASLSKLHIGRGSSADLAEARRIVSESQRSLLLQGDLLLGLFPGLDPGAVDPQSGLGLAVAGWRQTLTDLAAVQQILAGDANLLGFAPDFLMLLENFTAGGGPVVFDSFDSFQDILDPASSFSELGAALDALALADMTYGTYQGYEDQVATEFGNVTDATVARLRQIVGREPGQSGYDTPQINVGSEIWQQLQSIEVARVRIQKNQTEISNLNKEVQIEHNRAASQTEVVVRYAHKQAALTEEIGRINAAQAAANQLTEYFNPENLISGASIAIAINFGVQTNAELEKGEREAEKERLAGLEQAEIIGIDSAARVKTLLLRMNTLALDSKEAALLLNQELGRLVALYNEKANLERRRGESERALASRYFADPLHQLRSQHDLLQANIRFDEAQKWLFFMMRALDYKWNFPMTNYPHAGKTWSGATLFRLRNADELRAFYDAMNNFDFFASRGRGQQKDVFSVREHFLGFKSLDEMGRPAVYLDPVTGLSLDAVSAFRTNLLRRPIQQGQIQIEFSTARQLPDRPFFQGPVFNDDGSVFSKGLTLNKINFMKLRLVGDYPAGTPPTSGRLRYGGTSFVRNIFVGEYDPGQPNRVRNEMTAYSTRSWFYNLVRNVWQFRDAYEIEGVQLEFNRNPIDLNDPPTTNLTIEFKERSVATTGWVLSIPIAALQVPQLDDLQIYFDYVVSQRDLIQ